MTDLLGTDLAWTNGDVVVDATGDLAIETGDVCLVTDIVHRLSTWRGTYFRHRDHGMPWQTHLQNETDASVLLAVAQEIEQEVEQDPRVEPGSARATVQTLSYDRVRFNLTVTPIEGPHPLNLVIGGGLEDLTVEVLRGG